MLSDAVDGGDRRRVAGVRRHQRGEPAGQPPLAVGVDAEQLADHRERQRQGEAGDQVDRAVLRGQAVEQRVDGVGDPTLEGGQARRG